MRRILLPLAALGLSSCNKVGFDAVSIKPIYDYVDGCAEVKVSGHGFAEDASATLDMGSGATADLENQLPASQDPAVTDQRLRTLSTGYYLVGRTPLAPNQDGGYATVVVSSAGATDTLPDAFYYVVCPEQGHIDAYDPSDYLQGGETIAVAGCNLDATTMQVALYPSVVGDPDTPAATVALVSDCRTAIVHFVAPQLPDDSYVMAVVDQQGNVISGGRCVGDTTDTANPCAENTLTYRDQPTSTGTSTTGVTP